MAHLYCNYKQVLLPRVLTESVGAGVFKCGQAVRMVAFKCPFTSFSPCFTQDSFAESFFGLMAQPYNRMQVTFLGDHVPNEAELRDPARRWGSPRSAHSTAVCGECAERDCSCGWCTGLAAQLLRLAFSQLDEGAGEGGNNFFRRPRSLHPETLRARDTRRY